MKRTPRRLVSVLAVLVLLSGLAAGSASAAPAQSQPAGDDDQLEAYTAVVQPDELATIAEQGIDVSGRRKVANGVELDMVLDRAQADRLRGREST
jgi:uncharacterized protein involved in high-affinity Fe2+ transport